MVFPIPFSFGASHAAAGRYRLSTSGSSVVLSNIAGARMDTFSLNGERPVRIKPRRGESFLIADIERQHPQSLGEWW